MKRFLTWVSLTALGVAVFAQTAFAAPGDPPSFDAADLAAPMNDYATTLLTGIVAILGVVLVAAAAFTLVKIGVKAIRRWLGASKGTSTV